ncbi:MAG: hypothetical protein HY898_33905 [Deltaproteobacteria bacterium]|nr:hypothetical protein [Deltaproteobacteria bacterium]
MRTLHPSSVRDPLTGVFNRGHFDDRLAAESAYAIRHETERTNAAHERLSYCAGEAGR